jgi:ABC-type sugar transport system substrate-binding protein
MTFTRFPRRAVTATVATGLLLSMAACSGDSGGSAAAAGADKPLTLELNVYSRALPYYQDLVAGAEKTAKKLGVTLDVTYGETDPQLQYDQVENAVTSAPDGLIVAPIDQVALIPVIQMASENGVPVVTVGDNLAEEGRSFQLTFVGTEYEAVGKQKAEFIVDALGGQGKVAVIHGIRGLHFTEGQWADGALPVFEANPGITLIDGGYTGQFTTDAGLAATENLLTANPDLDAIYFDNDDLALGGVLALQQRGISLQDIVAIGTDGGAPARQAVAAGELDMTISICGYVTGVRAVEVLTAYLRDGDSPPAHVQTDTLTVTPDTAAEAEKVVERGEC